MKRHTNGMALPLVLLLLVALTAFGHAALVLSQREVQASAAFRDLIRAEKAAGVGLRLAISLTPDSSMDRTPWIPELLFTGELTDGLTYSVVRRWIDLEFFVLSGRGGVKGWPGSREVGLVGWTFHPGVRLTSFLAASEVGGELRFHDRSTFSADDFFSPPEDWPIGIGEQVRLRAHAFFEGVPLPGALRRVTVADSTGIPGMGLLSGTDLLLRSRNLLSRVSPGLGGGGVGCPGSGGRPVYLASTSSISLPRGRICGLVLTSGELTVGAGSVFQGLALVGENLVVEGNGRIEGMVRVGNDLILEAGAIFRGASVPALWTLEGIKPLQLPILVDPDPSPRT